MFSTILFLNRKQLENISPQVVFVFLTVHDLLHSLLAQTQFMILWWAIFKPENLVPACSWHQMWCFRYIKGKTRRTALFSWLQQKNFSCTDILSTSKPLAYFLARGLRTWRSWISVINHCAPSSQSRVNCFIKNEVQQKSIQEKCGFKRFCFRVFRKD